jgi:hypothetical protein
MKTVKELLSYLTAVGLLVLGLGAGSVWLLSPDPTMKAEAKAPIVPQKFLDSIERKKPVPVDVVAPVQAVVPVMQESPVSLPQPILRREAIREVSRPVPKPKRRQSASGPMSMEAPGEPARLSAAAPVTTSRTDFPY